MKIAVSGKGGVGKTTFSALLIRTLDAQGKLVLAIDADPDANLAGALGIANADKIIPISEMKDLAYERTEAQPGSIGGDVGTRFVNDRDHPERHAHAADLDSRRLPPEAADFTDGIGQPDYLQQPFGHAGDRFFGEREAVDQRRIELFRARGREVCCIRVEQALHVAPDRLCGERQRLVFGRGVGAGDKPRSSARLLADADHVALNIHMRTA